MLFDPFFIFLSSSPTFFLLYSTHLAHPPIGRLSRYSSTMSHVCVTFCRWRFFATPQQLHTINVAVTISSHLHQPIKLVLHFPILIRAPRPSLTYRPAAPCSQPHRPYRPRPDYVSSVRWSHLFNFSRLPHLSISSRHHLHPFLLFQSYFAVHSSLSLLL